MAGRADAGGSAAEVSLIPPFESRLPVSPFTPLVHTPTPPLDPIAISSPPSPSTCSSRAGAKGDGFPPCVPPPRRGALRARGFGRRCVPRPPPAPGRLCCARPRLVRHLPRRVRDPRLHLHCRCDPCFPPARPPLLLIWSLNEEKCEKKNLFTSFHKNLFTSFLSFRDLIFLDRF